MSDDTTAALQYLHSTINWEENRIVNISITKDSANGSILLAHTNEAGSKLRRVSCELDNNPIKRLIENVEEEVCVDCLEIDYLFKDPFFTSLIKAYVETIIIRYGSEVSISKQMAHAIIEYKLSDYTIICRTLDNEIELNDDNYKLYESDKCIFILKTNDRVREIQSDQSDGDTYSA